MAYAIDRPDEIRRRLARAEANAAQLRELLEISGRLEKAEADAHDRVYGESGDA